MLLSLFVAEAETELLSDSNIVSVDRQHATVFFSCTSRDIPLSYYYNCNLYSGKLIQVQQTRLLQ